MSRVYVYALYENGELVDEGTSVVLSQKYGVGKKAIGSLYQYNKKLLDRYTIVKVGIGKVWQYYAYKRDELIYYGTCREIADYLNCPVRQIELARKYGNAINGYKIVRKLTHEIKHCNIPIVKKDKTMTYLVKHLREFGNVSYSKSRKSLEHYVERLASEGIYVNVRRVKHQEDIKERFVLEVKK